jgi:hypothetical protein
MTLWIFDSFRGDFYGIEDTGNIGYGIARQRNYAAQKDLGYD